MAATVEIELETGEPGEEDEENEGDVGEVPSQLLVGSDQINSSSSNYQQVLSDNLPSSFSLSFLLTSCCCCFQQINDKKAALVITTGVLYYFAIGLTSISLSLLINQRIAGHAEHPNSDSVFVQSTVVFIHSTTSFIIGRYTSGLGDYLGRKPVLIASSLVCILSRYVYYSAHTPQVFYLAAILSGCLDLYYFSSLAWICDLFPEGPQRSKRVGLFSGTVGGLTLTIAAPLGAILAKYVSPGFPFVISPLLSLACTLLLLVMPVEDTLGAKKDPTALFYLTSNRALPANWKRYLLSHFPISFGALEVIKKAKHPLDWLTNFLMHITTSIMLMIFIQYLFVVFHWSAPLASGAVLFVGFCLGVFAPTLLHRYNPIPLAFYAMGFYTLGLTLLSIAGTGLERTESLGVIGIICLGFGISWVPALQSNLTSQYGSDIQGEVSGLLGQENDFSIWPSYVLCLGFTFALKRQGPIYWPGSTFGMTALLGCISLALHYSIYGREALILTLRQRSSGVPQRQLVKSCEEGDIGTSIEKETEEDLVY